MVAAATSRNALWLALLASPILAIEVPVGAGRVLSISAFDVVVVAAFVAVCRPYRPSSLGGALAGLGPLVLFAALAVVHSAATLQFGSAIQLAGLLRETVKYVGFAANVAMLVAVFRTEPMDRAPSRVVLVALAFGLGLGAMAYTWTPAYDGGGAYLTVTGAVLTVVAFLLASPSPRRSDRREIGVTTGALAAALAGAWWIWSKLFLLATAACMATYVARTAADRLGLRLNRRWFAAAGALATLIVLAAALYALEDWRFESSASVRLELWTIAVDRIGHSFPWGIGLGQFGAWLADLAPYKGDGQLRFVHNQFLAFVTETGAVGIVLSLIVLKLVADAAAAWQGVMRALFACILLGSLMLHDGIGLRALQLLLGYSFAVAVRPGASGSQRHRFA
jgi:hypothetical protein